LLMALCSDEGHDTRAVGAGLAAVAGRLGGPDRGPAAKALLEAIVEVEDYTALGALDQALVAIQKAIELEPNYAEGYGSMAMVLTYAGRPDEGLEAVQTSMRLNPFNSFFIYWVLGQCYFHLERFDEAAVQFERAVEANPQFLRGHLLLAATYGQLGRIEDAEWEAQEALTLLPGLTLRQRRAIVPYKKQADVERYIDGLRKAGIPE